MKHVIIFWCALISVFAAGAQGYNIHLQLHGDNKPAQVGLGYYYVGQGFRADSARVDASTGMVHFSDQRSLYKGLHFFILPGQPPLEFIVDNETEMHFATHLSAPEDSFRVVKSTDNAPFFSWRAYTRRRQQELESKRAMFDLVQRATKDREVLDEQRKNMAAIETDIADFTRRQRTKYPALFFSKLVNAALPPEMPASIPLYREKQLNPAYVQHFKNHFWDNYDFADQRLHYSKTLPDKLNSWIGLNGQSVDTLNQALDRMLTHTKPHTKTHQLVLQSLVQRFEDPSVTNGDAVFVHLFDQHFLSAHVAGIDTATWVRIEHKAHLFRPTLTGLTAPEIALPNDRDSLVSLRSFKAKYTMVYFFSPLCKSCQEATPGVYALTQEYAARGLRVLAVTTDGDAKDYWQNYARQTVPDWTCVFDPAKPSKYPDLFATSALPNCFFLDEQKKIVAKRVPIARLKEFLDAWVAP